MQTFMSRRGIASFVLKGTMPRPVVSQKETDVCWDL